MGPPIFIGGNWIIRVPRPYQLIASMGPPIFIGGNLGDFRGIDGEGNPASMGPPIFIGGNTQPVPRLRTFLHRFNGAADFHRRKYDGINAGRVKTRGASMGPPIFIGGNAEKGEKVFYASKLQWGRRFSSAEMLMTRLDSLKIISLQWGRRFSSAEIIF